MASDQVISKGFCGGCMRNKLFDYRSRTLRMWNIRFAPFHCRNGPWNFKIPGWNASNKKKKKVLEKTLKKTSNWIEKQTKHEWGCANKGDTSRKKWSLRWSDEALVTFSSRVRQMSRAVCCFGADHFSKCAQRRLRQVCPLRVTLPTPLASPLRSLPQLPGHITGAPPGKQVRRDRLPQWWRRRPRRVVWAAAAAAATGAAV